MSLPSDDQRVESVPGSELDESQEVDLSSLLDLQDQREEHEGKSSNRVILKSAVGLLVASLLAYAVVPPFRDGMHAFFRHLAECGQPRDPAVQVVSPQQQLQEMFGAHSSQVDEATRSLGVDPSKVDEGMMDEDVNAMMGESAASAMQRQRMLKGLKQVADGKAKKLEAAPDEKSAESGEIPAPPAEAAPKSK